MDNEVLLNDYYNETDEKTRIRYIDLMFLEYEDILNMIIKNIKEGKELRNNAYALNILSKKKKVQEYLEDNLTLSALNILLNSDDSKVRKNTYILLGNLNNSEYSRFLVEALDKESVNFCVSSIILALGNYKLDNINELLSKKLNQVEEDYKNNKIEKSHYEEIKKSINKVELKNIAFNKHEFVGFSDKRDIFLTIMNPLRNACMNEIKRTFKDAKFLNNGISVSTNDYLSVFKCRTFYEALLYTKSGLSLPKEKLFSYIANTLKSGFISSCHSNNETPFYYRVEVKSTMNKERKVKLIDDVKKYIDKEIPSYINNPSLYEFEIRIVEKENMFDVFFKLFTVDDNRYSYRVTDLPASINPTTAAILIQEIKGYLKDTSEVLDAFCGTSTMLIERSFAKSYKSLTGIDISEDAISYSMINANNVPLKINLVCENILKYQGPEFDEIISNMPFGNRVSNHELNITLYKRFIASIDKMLKPNGMAFLLTSEIALMKELINKNKNIRLVKNIYVESGGLKPHFFVVKKVA